jgi:ATP-dependent Clp protease adaptor protein ClpS
MKEQEKPASITQEEANEKTSLVPMYRVLLHNDEVTPMDFVVTTLLRFFISDTERAKEVMMSAHNDGLATAAVMPLERAEFKVMRAHNFIQAQNRQLTFTIESCE